MTFKYQIVLLGDHKANLKKLSDTLYTQTDQLGMQRDQVLIVDENNLDQLASKSPYLGVFFGYPDAADSKHPQISRLLNDSVPVITCLERGQSVESQIPKSLRGVNAFFFDGADNSWPRLATLILENFRLLRADRRLFISYKRSESEAVAIQLYEALDKAGFDVFLDTRSVPFGVEFQNVLWHRMADSDLVVLLDTPKFRESNWTQKELAQANATNVQILHILWPAVDHDPTAAFSQFLKLQDVDFNRSKVTRKLRANKLTEIVREAESLRARALAIRHRSLVDSFCDQARELGVNSITVQPQRFISVELKNRRNIVVVPTVGVPRADRYQEVDLLVRSTGKKPDRLWLLYDERGLLSDWISHLDWLNGHLPLAAVKVSNCAEHLK